MQKVSFQSAVPEGRPIRLSDATRLFAYESLDAKYGRALRSTPHIDLDETPGAASMSRRELYDLAIRRIAAEAPVRFADGELLCGSATLFDAVRHVVPAVHNGEPLCASVSHLTVAFDVVLRDGTDAYLARIAESEKTADVDGLLVLRSMRNVLDALRVWHGRYLDAIRARIPEDPAYWGALYENLERVPFAPPRTFREGLQSLWFTFAFIRLCGNWPGLGRVDQMLGGLLESDLAAGRITEDEARELTAHFLIKGCEWISHDIAYGGDAQHYQNLVLGGIDADGNEVTNTFTRLILECEEELPISDYPVAVRIGEKNPDWLLPLTARCMRHGSGTVAVYNEELVIRSMTGIGYPLSEARRFANDGCWEVQVPGETAFIYSPMDLFAPFLADVLGLPDHPAHFDSMEALYARFHDVMEGILDRFHRDADRSFADADSVSTVVSLFEEGCIEHAREYWNHGPKYAVLSPHFGGIPDVANSMTAIRKLVFEEKRVSFDRLMEILQQNWEGEEPLRQYARNRITYFGNGDPDADFYARRIVQDYIETCRKVERRNDVLRPPGISTFGRQIEWKDMRTASPHGHKTGEILAGNLSPTPGTDWEGATAVIRSHCGTGLERLTCGTALDIKLDPTSVAGEDGVRGIMELIRGFVSCGGFFMQIDVTGTETLLDAQKHPEKYPTLAVRLSGWSARFITLDENWQRMVIERTSGGRI